MDSYYVKCETTWLGDAKKILKDKEEQAYIMSKDWRKFKAIKYS